jgi:hypothetical protein
VWQIRWKKAAALSLKCDQICRHTRFFPKFAISSIKRFLASVDATLWHLPSVRVTIVALTDKNMPAWIGEQDPDTWAIR